MLRPTNQAKTGNSARFQYKAMLALAKKLRPIFSSSTEAEALCISTIASVSLAQTGVVPEEMAQSPMAPLIEQYCGFAGLPSPAVDRTRFAIAGSAIFQKAYEPAKKLSPTTIQSIARILASDDAIGCRSTLHAQHAGPACQSCSSLDAAWMKQCLTKLTQQEQANQSKNATAHVHKSRAGAADVPALTQWFTPEWIAEFLIAESIAARKDATFLDPAAGAGHLLSAALRKFVSLRQNKLEGLHHILAHQLFGVDIDEHMIELANLAIYLDARRISREEPFPLPHFYTICSPQSGAANLGTLWLVCKEIPKNVFLKRLGNEPEPLQNFPRAFDAIAMNPPYLSHRSIPEDVAALLAKYYPHSRYDLYAAFLELAVQLLAPSGRLATICQQSFLTVQRYHRLRCQILNQAKLKSVVQLGAGAFATKDGEKVNNAVVVFESAEKDASDRIHCRRILTSTEKLSAEELGITKINAQMISRTDCETLFHLIPNGPLSFWAPPEVLQLFAIHPPLESTETGIVCTNGLFTCNNNKFVKHFSTVPASERQSFVPYDKGGGQKWYRTTDLLLHWQNNGEAIREYRLSRGQSASLPGEAFYFKDGVTYSYIGTKGFAARMLTPNAVFDIASSAIFSSRFDLYYLLGWLNSSLVRCMLGILNPTINFQIGDVRRLPFAVPGYECEQSVAEGARLAVEMAKQLERLDSSSPCYQGANSAVDSNALFDRSIIQEAQIQAQIDNHIFELYHIGAGTRRKVLSDPWVKGKSGGFGKTARKIPQL